MYIKLRKTRSPRGVDQKSAVIEIYIFLIFSFKLVERILDIIILSLKADIFYGN